MKLAAPTALTVTLPGAGALIDLFDADKQSDDDVPPDPTLQGFRKQFAEIMESDELKPLERVSFSWMTSTVHFPTPSSRRLRPSSCSCR